MLFMGGDSKAGEQAPLSTHSWTWLYKYKCLKPQAQGAKDIFAGAASTHLGTRQQKQGRLYQPMSTPSLGSGHPPGFHLRQARGGF